MTNLRQASAKPPILIHGPLEGSDANPAGAIELAFLLDEATRFSPFISGLQAGFADSLAHAVAASPDDLLHHTRRVFHSYERHDGEGLYAALADLFLSLQERGHGLRKRLLNGARDRLAPEHYQALALWLVDARVPQQRPLPAARGAVLARGVEGRRELVRVSVADGGAVRDPLVEAREYIEYSQLEQARELLEAAVPEDPGREELQLELLSLYRAARDDRRYLSMRARLEALLGVLPEYWQALEPQRQAGDRP